MRLLKNPESIPSEPAAEAALMRANAAWNCAAGDTVLRDQHRGVVGQIDRGGLIPWAGLRSNDTDQLIAELVEHKRKRYPNDHRRIVVTEMSLEENVRVHGVEHDKSLPHTSDQRPDR